MPRNFVTWTLSSVAILSLAGAIVLAAQDPSSLVVDGLSGEAKVVSVQGHSYVDVESLARLTNGSIHFSGNKLVLTIPGLGSTSPSPATKPSEFSKDFLANAIEAMFQLREWHAALRSSIEHSYPIPADYCNTCRRGTQESLRLTNASISTDADRNAYVFLDNEFRTMDSLSQKYIQMAQSLTYIAPDSLRNDPLEQKLTRCGHQLSTMASSRSFVDNGDCN
jgi:hypothetical protein